MKKVFSILLICISPFLADAQLKSNGATLNVSSGATLILNGDLTLASGSAMGNNGEFHIKGNISNDITIASPGTGTLFLEGNANQIVSGSGNMLVKNLVINNASGITINSGLKIDGLCSFTNGIVAAGNAAYPVSFTANAVIDPAKPASDASFINGYVSKEGTGNFSFPTGDNTHYQKIDVNIISNSAGLTAQYTAGDAGAGPFTSGGTTAYPLAAYNNAEYWTVTPRGFASGNVKIYWDSYLNSGITNTNDLAVARKTGGNWQNEGAISVSGNAVSGYVTGNTINRWGQLTLGSISAFVVAVKLQSFAAMASAKDNLLKWETASEESGMIFTLQKSSGANNFKDFATLNARGTAGAYDYRDSKYFSPVTYYRLKTTDANGKESFSNISAVKRKSAVFISISPVPAKSSVTITNSNDAMNGHAAAVSDVQGNVIYRFNLKKIQQIDISRWVPGNYFLHTEDGSVIRFVKQ